MKRLVVLLVLIVTSQSIYLNNTIIKRSENEDNPAFWTESEIWGPLVEEWVLGSKNNREQRVMKLIPIDNNYIISNKKDTEVPGKVINGITVPEYGSVARPPPPVRQISESELYLLRAIEKMVYRTDFIEKRLRRVEEMLYYVMAGSRVDHEPCPENFTRAGTNCYFFADQAGREKDWKTSSKLCHKLGAVLAEMETIEENQDVVAHIQTHANLRGKDFWTGGLNPGLLWIWSNSARPVSTDKNPPSNTTSAKIRGDGRCLRLAYDPAHRNYAYFASDCSARFQYICELADKSTSNRLARLARERNLEI